MLQEKTGAKMVIIQDGPGQELVIKALFNKFMVSLNKFHFKGKTA